MKTTTEITQKQSERIFWVIQTIFGFIIARSFSTYGSVFLPPLKEDLITVTLALLAVYGCVLWSWIDFSYALILSPYNFENKSFERYRFASDLFIVLTYTYLLLYIDTIKASPASDMTPFIYAFAVVYFGYVISGLFRILEYGRRASRIYLIAAFLLLFVVLSIVYATRFAHASSVNINRCFLLGIFILNGSYRIIRSKLVSRKSLIGVDVDGVLANQINGLLPLIKQRYDVNLAYDDVTDWRLPIAETSIDQLIVEQQQQRPFIIKMPVHDGASPAISKIIRKHRIAIATARPPESDEWTKQWLVASKISFDAYYNLREGNKQNAHETFDILIDDYQGNVSAFLDGHSDKGAILFSQPWNGDRTMLDPYVEQGRLFYVGSWSDIPSAIDRLLKSLKRARNEDLRTSPNQGQKRRGGSP